jgi:putative endonuclease
MYYVYILRCRDKSLYTGITTDVARRFKEHRAGIGGHYTRSRGVEKIAYKESAVTRSVALKREAEIKKWPRQKKVKFIAGAKRRDVKQTTDL